MTTGRVIKNYNGFYYVDTGKQELVECRRRGKLKAKILVGDQLSLTMVDNHKGVIEAVLPRTNALRRPAVARCSSSWPPSHRTPTSSWWIKCS